MTEEIGSTPHRIFTILYAVTCAFAIFVSVSSAVVTDHWKDGINGCILYSGTKQQMVGNVNVTSLYGSSITNCNYAIFTPILFIVVCCVAIAFHLRSIMCKRCWRAEEGKADFWATTVRIIIILCAIMTLLSLVLCCMLTHGYDITCSAIYQSVDSKASLTCLDISANMAHDFFARQHCSFYYSLLDFGNLVANNYENMVIDSNVALTIAIATGWLQFFMWLGLTVANLWLASQMQISLELPFSVPALPCFSKE